MILMVLLTIRLLQKYANYVIALRPLVKLLLHTPDGTESTNDINHFQPLKYLFHRTFSKLLPQGYNRYAFQYVNMYVSGIAYPTPLYNNIINTQ